MCITGMISCKTCDVAWGTYIYARYMYKGMKTYAVISLQWGSLCPERRCLYWNGTQVAVPFYNIPINQIVNLCTSPTKLRLLLQDQVVVPGTSLLGQSMTQWCLTYISQNIRYRYQDLNHQNVSITHKMYTLETVGKWRLLYTHFDQHIITLTQNAKISMSNVNKMLLKRR